MPAPDLAVRCRSVRVEHRTATGAVRALHDVDLDVVRHRLTVIAGPSGSGKSSLLRALAGLDTVGHGAIELDGIDIAARRPRDRRRLRRRAIGVVLQEPAANLLPYLTAREQIVLAADLRGRGHDDVDDLLDAVGLRHRAGALPSALSGGEQQRVAFAAAAVGQPALVLADEPTAALDAKSAAQLVDTMRSLARRGSTIVATSHDSALIDAADDVVRLVGGVVQR